jgi:hypothetical protein
MAYIHKAQIGHIFENFDRSGILSVLQPEKSNLQVNLGLIEAFCSMSF